MDWLEKHFREVDTFPRPDWEAINSDAEKSHKDKDQHDLWCDIARSWMLKLKSSMNSNYAIHESDNFILVTSESERYVSNFLGFLERTLARILTTLHGIASDDGYGKYVVIIFDDIDEYYSYISYFYEEDGEYGLSSGVYLNKGYGHFVFPHQEPTYAESVAAHEMTHALVSHLPIPAWVNEGMAVGIENLITGSAPLQMDKEMFGRHISFWGNEEIQEFWSGDVFHRSDEGQELSYHLAQFAINSLSQDYDSFVEFVNNANYEDGGETAAQRIYEGSLGNLIAQYFGEGEWSPRPTEWEMHSNKSLKSVDALKRADVSPL